MSEQFYKLPFSHQKLIELLNKLDKGILLTQEEYQLLLKTDVLFSGDYNDLINKPEIPDSLYDLKHVGTFENNLKEYIQLKINEVENNLTIEGVTDKVEQKLNEFEVQLPELVGDALKDIEVVSRKDLDMVHDECVNNTEYLQMLLASLNEKIDPNDEDCIFITAEEVDDLLNIFIYEQLENIIPRRLNDFDFWADEESEFRENIKKLIYTEYIGELKENLEQQILNLESKTNNKFININDLIDSLRIAINNCITQDVFDRTLENYVHNTAFLELESAFELLSKSIPSAEEWEELKQQAQDSYKHCYEYDPVLGKDVEHPHFSENDIRILIEKYASTGGGGGGSIDCGFNPNNYYTRDKINELHESMNSNISNKVDKISGMGLSQENFTSIYKAKLDSLPTNVADELEIKNYINQIIGDLEIGGGDGSEPPTIDFNNYVTKAEYNNKVASLEAEITSLKGMIGDITNLETTDTTNLVNAINSLIKDTEIVDPEQPEPEQPEPEQPELPYQPGTDVNDTVTEFRAYEYNPVTKSIPVKADGNYTLSFDYGPNIGNQGYTATVTVGIYDSSGSVVDSYNESTTFSGYFSKDFYLQKDYSIKITARISETTHSTHCNEVSDIKLVFNSL